MGWGCASMGQTPFFKVSITLGCKSAFPLQIRSPPASQDKLLQVLLSRPFVKQKPLAGGGLAWSGPQLYSTLSRLSHYSDLSATDGTKDTQRNPNGNLFYEPLCSRREKCPVIHSGGFPWLWLAKDGKVSSSCLPSHHKFIKTSWNLQNKSAAISSAFCTEGTEVPVLLEWRAYAGCIRDMLSIHWHSCNTPTWWWGNGTTSASC